MPIIAATIDRFPAWAMRRFHRRSEPILVYERRRVVALSHPERNPEITEGDSIERARALAPELLFYLRDHVVERSVWEETLERLYRLTPFLQPEKSPNSAWVFLDQISRPDLDSCTQELQAQVGVGPDRLTALLAALQAPVGQIREVLFHESHRFLKGSPPALLSQFGFTGDLTTRLDQFGLRSIWSTLRLERRQLNAQFGSEGDRLFFFLHPPQGQKQTIPSFHRETVEERFDFDWPVVEPGEVVPILQTLIGRLLDQTLDNRITRIELRVQSSETREWKVASRILSLPSRNGELLLRAGERLLDTLFCPETPIQTLIVVFGGLTPHVPEQQDLFFRRHEVDTLIQAMNRRFPDQLKRTVILSDTPFFPEEGVQLVPA